MCIYTRWNMNSINTLPDNLVLCFLAIYNAVNEMAYDIFKLRGIKCLPYLTKSVCNITQLILSFLYIFSINKTKLFV